MMFRDFYKQSIKSKEELQERRRLQLLEEQKRKRLQLHDGLRELDRSCQVRPKRKGARTFTELYGDDYALQLSEWLRERPYELCDWLLVPCPKGQRCLVVAGGGRTAMYSKAGRRRFTFHSSLPGDAVGCKTTTLLDCIFVQELDTFYVLDALVFGNQELVNCEAQFRFFWLRSKFEEYEGLSERSAQNEKPMVALEQFDFENMERVAMAFQRFPFWTDNAAQLDGFLFYHKEASYTCGTTPLVGWLFPFMVPDVLGFTVSSAYEQPAEYANPLSYMEAFDAKLAQKKRQGHTSANVSTSTDAANSAMDVASVQEEPLQYLLEAERKLEMDELEERSGENMLDD